MTIRTRFAPSPTGYLHVGGIRTALFAYLVAKQAGGQLVLRLEDTDKKREVAGSAEHLVASLKSLGINYDEGPDIGGDYGPYRQSDRLDIYKRYAQKLIDEDRAYADPYTAEQMQEFRDNAQANKRAFRYRDYRPENPPQWDGTTPLRFKSEPKDYNYHDEIFGDVHTSAEVVDDFILIKSDGYPTYNFAHIVDDYEMGITHVIRGQEFISSMPNYLALYEALGFDVHTPGMQSDGSDNHQADEHSAFPAEVGQDKSATSGRPDVRGLMGGAKDPLQSAGERPSAEAGSAFPAEREQDDSSLRSRVPDEADGSEQNANHRLKLPVFAHMPHIMNEQGNKKLGKRDGAKDVLEYVRDGYLPEALDSFIATLGWNDGTEQEVFTMDELLEKFSLSRVQRSGARFDEKRLLWMNGHFIRELSLDELYGRVEYFWPESAKKADEGYRKRVLALAQDRLKTLKDLPVLTDYFFAEPKPNLELITSNKQLKKLSAQESMHLLQQAHDSLKACDDWTAESIQDCLNQLLETTGQKPGVLFSLIRIATTWAPFSPQLNDTLALLGRETTLKRLRKSIEVIPTPTE